MKQDARSLGKYLGQKVRHTVFGECVLYAVSLNWDDSQCALLNHKGEFVNCKCDDIVPVLKTYEDLIVPDENGKPPIEVIYDRFDKDFKIQEGTWEAYHRIEDRDGNGCVSKFFEDITKTSEGYDGGFTPEIIEKLNSLGFGAIKNEESSTGYLDLFGRECVKG